MGPAFFDAVRQQNPATYFPSSSRRARRRERAACPGSRKQVAELAGGLAEIGVLGDWLAAGAAALMSVAAGAV